MEKNIRERKKLKLWVRIVLMVIITIGFFLPLLGVYTNMMNIKNTKKTKLYSSTINKNSTYKVQLFDNKFTNKTEMDSNQVYISDLVKNIKLNLFYTYSGTDKANLNYTYDIKAKLYGENTNSTTSEKELVWEKDYIILDEKKKSVTEASGFNIHENINIDYPKYKEEVINFKKQFGMNLTIGLKIVMNIKYNGNYKENLIHKTDKIVLEIPLGIQAFSIKENYTKKDTFNIYINNKTMNTNNSVINIIYIMIIIITVIILLSTYKAIFNIQPKSEYTKQLHKILKSYGEIIVEVKTPVKSKGYTIMQVKSFEEMIDLEEELRIPIILYENIYKCNAVFTITYNKTIYKYILRDKI